MLADWAEKINETSATSYHTFADDIKFNEVRLMAMAHKAQYFAKHFWNKTPDSSHFLGLRTSFRVL